MTSDSNPARGYSIAFARDMIPEKMKAYSASLPPIYEKYSGKYLAIGGQGRGVDWLCGDWPDRMIMIGEFPSPCDVSDFWWSPEYRESVRLREGAVTVDVGAVPGTDQAPDENDKVFLLIVMDSETPMTVDGGKALISATPGDITTLEGGLEGLSIKLVGFPSREDLDAAWKDVKELVENLEGHACAANRAPG